MFRRLKAAVAAVARLARRVVDRLNPFRRTPKTAWQKVRARLGRLGESLRDFGLACVASLRRAWGTAGPVKWFILAMLVVTTLWYPVVWLFRRLGWLEPEPIAGDPAAERGEEAAVPTAAEPAVTGNDADAAAPAQPKPAGRAPIAPATVRSLTYFRGLDAAVRKPAGRQLAGGLGKR